MIVFLAASMPKVFFMACILLLYTVSCSMFISTKRSMSVNDVSI